MCKVLIVEDSATQRHEMERGATMGGADEVIAEERWGFIVSELAQLTPDDLVIADYNVPDLPANRTQVLGLLQRARIPFRIVTAYIQDVEKDFRQYAEPKQVNLALQVAGIVQQQRAVNDHQSNKV